MENQLGVSESTIKDVSDKVHNEVFPLLSLLNLNIQQIKQSSGSADYALQAETTLRKVTSEVRNLYTKMSSFLPGRSGLECAITSYFLLAMDYLPVTIEHDVSLGRNIPKAVQLRIYHLIQRLVQIVLEDEGADYINISVIENPKAVLIKIRDNRYSSGWRRAPKSLTYPMYPNLHHRLSVLNGRIMAFMEPDHICYTVAVIPLKTI